MPAVRPAKQTLQTMMIELSGSPGAKLQRLGRRIKASPKRRVGGGGYGAVNSAKAAWLLWTPPGPLARLYQKKNQKLLSWHRVVGSNCRDSTSSAFIPPLTPGLLF